MVKNIAIFALTLALIIALGKFFLNSLHPELVEEQKLPMDKVIYSICNDTSLANAAVGICILNEAGEIIAEHNAQTPLIPASTFKTLTAATGLEILGSSFRFSTKLELYKKESAEEEEEEEKPGILVIRGGGDPTVNMNDLEQWAKKLVADGLEKLEQVRGDGSLFPGEIVGDFWGWGDVGNGYGSPISGLNLEHNRYLARFKPAAKRGDPAIFLGATPKVPGVHWDNQVLTGSPNSGDGVMIYAGPWAQEIRMKGTIPSGNSEFSVRGAVPNPPLFAAYHLDQFLRELGVKIAKEPISGSAPDGLVSVLHHHDSAPLHEVVKHLMAVSDNHETECIYRMLEVKENAPAATVIRRHWEGRGLDLRGCRIVDGSGLSRADYISPYTLARLQHLAATGVAKSDFINSFNKMENGRIRWKIGYMSSIRSYCGLVTTKSGEQLSFAILFNHYPDIQPVLAHVDAFVAAILDY